MVSGHLRECGAVIPAPDLIAMLEAHLGVEGDTAVARALGYGPGGERKVKRWREGDSTPRYEDAWLLLETLGMLTDGSVQTDAGEVTILRGPAGHPRSLESEVAALGETISTILDENTQGFEEIRIALRAIRGALERIEQNIPQTAEPSPDEADEDEGQDQERAS